MKVIAGVLSALLLASTATASNRVFHAKSGKSGSKVAKGMDDNCNPETIQGLWQYISQRSGTPWNAYIGCTSSGLPEGTTRCQMTDQPQYPGDCVAIAYFDPGYISVNENGYCSFGYNGKGLVVFEETQPDCAYPDFIKNGDYMAKAQVTPGGILEILFSDDGGSTFYNEADVRLALNAAAH